MVVGIDASRSIDSVQKTGVENVSDGLIHALVSSEFENAEFIFYTPESIDWLPSGRQRIFGPRRLWTIVGLSFEMIRCRPDVLFVPVHALPFFCPKRTFRIIHDIASLKQPNLYSWFQRMLIRWDVWRSVRICEKIFVSTQHVKNDLLTYTSARDGQIIVMRFGYKRMEKWEKGKKEGKRKRQMLYVGRIEEKKNIGNLIEGFELFSQKFPGYTLVLVGKPGYGYDQINFKIQNSKLNIKEIGFVSEEEKWKLLLESVCLVHVPCEEGFSFPLLEAFDAGLPVVASDISALREVGSDACIYVDPFDPLDIARGMELVTSDSAASKQRVQAGCVRLEKYSWDTYARYLSDLFMEH